jgi:hypothetical protein
MRAAKFRKKHLVRILRVTLLACSFASLCIVAAAQSSDFPARAAQELANLHEGITLATWMRAHPNDTRVLYSHRHWDWGNWIVRADNRERLADGRELIRRAYFYAPDPPADMSLPPSASSQRIRDGAQLGFIWLETNEPNTMAGHELAERTREELSRQFAKGQNDLKIWFANAGSWSKTAKWNVGPVTVVSAYESIDAGPRPPRVLAFGFIPVSGLHVDLGGGEDIYGEAFDAELRSLDEAIAASGLPEEDLAPIRSIKKRIEDYYSGKSETWKSAVGDEVIDALKKWLFTSRKRGRRQYAAALLAADTALDLSIQFVNPDNEAIRKRLQAIGANFIYAQLDGYMYTHGWLKKALRLGRGGLIGDLSLISMMEKGFNLSAMCEGIGYEGSRRVIFEGERFLSRSRNPKLRGRVHLLVAEAYSDVVALADGAGEEYVHAAKYLRAAPWARSMAIAHYRHLLRLTHSAQTPKRTWKQLWRLLAGAPPTGTYFFCVYD